MSDPKAIIAEDDENIRRLLSVLLKREGFEVLPAANGVEALELLSTTEAEVLLLDLMMPVMSGFEVLQHIEQNGKKGPCIIVVSAVPDAYLDRVREQAWEVITKPFDATAIGPAVRHCVDAWKAGQRIAPVEN